MTLIITAVTPLCVLQAGDRLLTRMVNGKLEQFDERSNKSVIYEASDGTLAISYCGLALISGKLTDEWIAEKINPSLDVTGGWTIGTSSSPDDRVLSCDGLIGLLQSGLSKLSSSTFKFHELNIIIAGWKIKGNTKTPIMVKIRRRRGSAKLEKTVGFKQPAGSKVNCRVDLEGSGATAEVMAYLVSEIISIHENRNQPISDEEKKQYFLELRMAMANIIKFASSMESSVGSTAHVVTIHRPDPDFQFVQTHFYNNKPTPLQSDVMEDDVEDSDVTGWVILDGIVYAPSYIVGKEKERGRIALIEMNGTPGKDNVRNSLYPIVRRRS